MAEEEAPGDYINERQDLHDCFFLVGSEKKERISTIKFFLVNYSPYFRAMLLETDMRERGSKEDIVMPDHEPDVFKLMLRYVYGGQDLTFKNIDQAMRFHLLVDKCLMSKLKKISSEYLIKNCTTNICEVLECHVLLGIKEMESQATEMVKNNIESLIASKDFEDLNIAIVLFIVKQETLSISEVELWNGVLKWARHQSGVFRIGKIIRKALGEVLKHMRFLAMSSKEFAEQVVPTSVLTPEEVIAVFVSMATGNNFNLPSSLFSCRKKREETTLDIPLTPFYQTPLPNECSCTIQVKSKKLQLINIKLREDLPDFILISLLHNDQQIYHLAVRSIENEYKLNPPFELQPNTSYELTVIHNPQLWLLPGSERYSLSANTRRGLHSSVWGQTTSGAYPQMNLGLQTRTDILGDDQCHAGLHSLTSFHLRHQLQLTHHPDCERAFSPQCRQPTSGAFPTMNLGSETGTNILGDCKFCTIKRICNVYGSYGQFMSCLKSLQFTT